MTALPIHTQGPPPADPRALETLVRVEACSVDVPCAICLEDINESASCGHVAQMPRCSHIFHESCVLPWLRDCNGTCPVCRTPLAEPPLPLPVAAAAAGEGGEGQAAPSSTFSGGTDDEAGGATDGGSSGTGVPLMVRAMAGSDGNSHTGDGYSRLEDGSGGLRRPVRRFRRAASAALPPFVRDAIEEHSSPASFDEEWPAPAPSLEPAPHIAELYAARDTSMALRSPLSDATAPSIGQHMSAELADVSAEVEDVSAEAEDVSSHIERTGPLAQHAAYQAERNRLLRDQRLHELVECLEEILQRERRLDEMTERLEEIAERELRLDAAAEAHTAAAIVAAASSTDEEATLLDVHAPLFPARVAAVRAHRRQAWRREAWVSGAHGEEGRAMTGALRGADPLPRLPRRPRRLPMGSFDGAILPTLPTTSPEPTATEPATDASSAPPLPPSAEAMAAVEHVLATGSSGVNSSAASELSAEGLAAIAGTQPSDPAAEFLAVAELQATAVPDAEVPPHVPGRGAGDTSKR